jgi:NAD(P)-dependent dehydrogenase (short-subunit alcohol dehydrogenase family)
MNLRGKTALITGAGSGIGREFAPGIAREGADVAINDLIPEAGDGIIRNINATAGEYQPQTSPPSAPTIEILAAHIQLNNICS